MASLKDIVKREFNNITLGVAWVIIYKENRSWQSLSMRANSGTYDTGYRFSRDDMEKMLEAANKDHKAVCINGQQMEISSDITRGELEDKIYWMYTNRRNLLKEDFLECLVDLSDNAENEKGKKEV